MPDITMCKNAFCSDKEKCYRWTAKPNPRWQSWSSFEGPSGKDPCKAFVESTSQKETGGLEHRIDS